MREKIQAASHTAASWGEKSAPALLAVQKASRAHGKALAGLQAG